MKRTALLSAFLISLTAAPSAHADAKEEARKHFNRAVELVDDGQLEGALVEFQRSYDLTHHFAVLYNMGQVLVSLARPVEAFDAYQRYLTEGGDLVPAARRTEVEKEMARQKARIATIEVRVLPDGALVRLDGREVGRSPLGAALRVGVGKHAISAAAEGYDPAASEITVAGEDYKMVSLPLAKSPVAVTLPPPAAPAMVAATPPLEVVASSAPAAEQPMSKLRIAGIVGGALGLAGLAAGGAFWLAAGSRHDDAMRVYKDDYGKAQGLQSEAKDYVTAANVAFVAGGSLVALGVVAIIVGRPDSATAGSGTHAYLLPTLGPGSAGVSAEGSW